MFGVLSSRRLTEETLSTTMCFVEQISNARPLTANSCDPQDLEAITPNNILLNCSTVFLPCGLTQLQISHVAVFSNKPNRTMTGYGHVGFRTMSRNFSAVVNGFLIRLVP